MHRSAIQPMPEYFDRYITLVEDIELQEAFEKSLLDISSLDKASLEALGNKVYAPGKWTVKDILQHIIDTERVFSYRAMRFARNDKTALPGFDQDEIARYAPTGNRTLEGLLNELKLVRQSTIALYQSFDEAALLRKGMNWRSEMSVLAIGFNIIGHQLYHFRLIEKLYKPLLEDPAVI